ncbi:prolyl oligopeptidase family serine peptidase, partial [Rugamonas sp. FT82W]
PEGARSYLLATPDQPLAGARPLLILLHGRGGSAAQVLGRGRLPSPLSLWLEIADRERWIVVAPNGVNGSDGKSGWNDCRADAPGNPRVDDIGFIKAIIDAAVARGEADPARIYVMGMSNGGIMALRAASELGERLAAVAAVSAGAP